jgi:hypothetical protein
VCVCVCEWSGCGCGEDGVWGDCGEVSVCVEGEGEREGEKVGGLRGECVRMCEYVRERWQWQRRGHFE